MIRINLLPHREATKKARKDTFGVNAFLAALVGGLMAGGVYLGFQTLISQQEAANELVRQENEKLKVQIKDIASIESEINALKARQDAVENLQSERNLPVQLLNSILVTVPSGAYLVDLKQNGNTVSLSGKAQSNQTVADLLDNIALLPLWESKPQLVQSKASNITLSNGQDRRVFEYALSFSLAKAASAQEADAIQAAPSR
ncbi:type IV pilus assembly protein PilN [Lampropedia hyalina DSM 16112]|jgi:type IV pilus assembly protein PilN|uniref:Type IV pilus assembly protein PilN n=1 Tax=Lampropedia hyalina DSM 16112 TaxID=1122156 RepID=A0A1M4SQG8_9BURK|nr:PilN domain-containing protein [Lampropedia hyalina]SHE34429.1 type IV pilus assembly protein PilN [Lampropedia hyalina DSM 16112]